MQNKEQYSIEEDNKNTDSDSINDLQEKEEEEQQLYKQFYSYLSNKDIKNARKMLRKYNIFNSLKSRDLNEQFDLDNYKFTKRNGVLTLYKPINKQEQQHFEEIERDIHNIEEQENIAKMEYKIEQIEKIAYKIEELEHKLNTLDRLVVDRFHKLDNLHKDLITLDRLVADRFDRLESKITPIRW